MSKQESDINLDLFYSNLHAYVKEGYSFEYRTLYVSDVEEFEMNKALRALSIMDTQDGDIHIVVNSFGGSVYDGLALYDKIRNCKNKVITYNQGKVMSMGLILFVEGDVRNMSEHSTAMAHSVSSGTWGKVAEMENNVKETKRLNSLLVDILADRTKKTKAFWENEIKHEDKFYNKAMCKKLGII